MNALISALLACTTVEPPPAEVPAPPAPQVEPVASGGAEPATERLDLNAATAEQLGTVPGAGEKMVHEFMEYRPYVSISQFRKEMAKYVDAETIAGYERHLYVPIDPAASDVATLQQLPGLTAEEAEKLVAARPYLDRGAFLQTLKHHVTPEELASGEAWVR